ncbi:MAG: chitobiase/beta-hexosaminidase C-terminal domain-containing protein [Saprospiraceae bacterium]|nr:chitobiase/beta-hexosaminidase C-terminal domain-containing protein [Saprospiraceae bacterium]
MLNKAIHYAITALSVLLAGGRAAESYLQLPVLMQWAGRFHLLLLHFPIVLVLLLAGLIWFRPDVVKVEWLGGIAVIALVAALSGLFLSLQEKDGGSLLAQHKWAGAFTAFLCVGAYAGWNYLFKQKSLQRIFTIVLSLSVIITGHWGGTLTHGREFLAYPGADKTFTDLADDPLIYAQLVQPILQKRCISCHSEEKKKGGLLLTSYEALRKGGKNGTLFDTGNWHNSLLLKRLELPLAHKEHMPPQSKPQLSEQELAIIRLWLAKGASDTLAFRHLPPGDTLALLVNTIIQAGQSDRWAHLPKIKDETISGLGNYFCTIQRLSANSQALSVQLYAHPDFSAKDLERLLPLAKNTIELDLSGLPLDEKALGVVARFKALERLEIDRTPVTDAGLALLKELPDIRVLKAYQTKLTDKSLSTLKQWKKLQRVYAWQTGISPATLGKIYIDTGADTSIHFKAILSKPEILEPRAFFDQPFALKLFHRIKGIDIRYTLDGRTPTSTSTLLGRDSIILIDKPVKVKYIAIKEGWESSQADSIELWRTSPPPPVTKLIHPPNDSYKGRGVASLFDHKKASLEYSDTLWLGFREQPMIMEASWPAPVSLSSVTLSTLFSVDSYIFPPTVVEVWGGNSAGSLKRIGLLKPDMPGKSMMPANRFYTCEVSSSPIRYLRVIARPIPTLPGWHPGKGDKGWVFVDEVVVVTR